LAEPMVKNLAAKTGFHLAYQKVVSKVGR